MRSLSKSETLLTHPFILSTMLQHRFKKSRLSRWKEPANGLIRMVGQNDSLLCLELEGDHVDENDHSLPHLGQILKGFVHVDALHHRSDDESPQRFLDLESGSQIHCWSHCKHLQISLVAIWTSDSQENSSKPPSCVVMSLPGSLSEDSS
jgi:hypothetical protein